MADGSILRALSRETKALILASEYEARRMPVFQLGAVLAELAPEPEERKLIIDLLENELKASGHHPDEVTAFLSNLLEERAEIRETRLTRLLRLPFAADAVPPASAPAAERRPDGLGAAPPQPSAPTAVPADSPPAAVTPVPTAARSPAASAVSAVAPAGPSAAAAEPSSAPDAGVAAPAPPSSPARPATAGASGGTRLASTSPAILRTTAYFGILPSMLTPEAFAKPKVLLADDDKRIRIVFRMMLERVGCTVLEAGDGDLAWKIIQGGVDLVVLDMKMPGLHGLDILARMVDRHITPPVVICSAFDQFKSEFVVRSYPKLRYLTKPSAAEALEKATRELLNLPAK